MSLSRAASGQTQAVQSGPPGPSTRAWASTPASPSSERPSSARGARRPLRDRGSCATGRVDEEPPARRSDCAVLLRRQLDHLGALRGGALADERLRLLGLRRGERLRCACSESVCSRSLRRRKRSSFRAARDSRCGHRVRTTRTGIPSICGRRPYRRRRSPRRRSRHRLRPRRSRRRGRSRGHRGSRGRHRTRRRALRRSRPAALRRRDPRPLRPGRTPSRRWRANPGSPARGPGRSP